MRPVPKLIGARVKELRKEQNLRAVDVAVLVDVDPSHYYAVERGTAKPSLDLIVAIAHSFRVDESDLFVWPGTGLRAELHELIRRAPNSALAELKTQLEKVVPAGSKPTPGKKPRTPRR